MEILLPRTSLSIPLTKIAGIKAMGKSSSVTSFAELFTPQSLRVYIHDNFGARKSSGAHD